jgi:acetoacetate decarboxylase
MKIKDIKEQAFSMPIYSPSGLKNKAYKFVNREYFVISYETDIELLQAIVPEPLKVVSNVVKFEFMKMPDAHGFGIFQESGQVIEVEHNGVKGSYSHMMFLNDVAPIVAGREIWGFPKKYGTPTINVDVDTLVGKLKYNHADIAIATMGYKYDKLNSFALEQSLERTPNFLLKIIPHANGKEAEICQLIQYGLIDVKVHEAWSGPTSLQLFNHALAPVADLPVRRIIGGNHFIADLTLGFGKVIYDYLKD